MTYDILRFLHVIGATVLLGTGAGIAFFMVVSNLSADPRLIAHVGGIVVLADTVFTATAAIVQPITGSLLAREEGWPVLSGWVGLTHILANASPTRRTSGGVASVNSLRSVD